MKKFNYTFIIASAISLFGCGGGGGSGSNSSIDNASVQTLPTWTNITDSNFERALVSMGLDDVVEGQVLTSKISGITQLSIRKDYYNPTTSSGTSFSNLFSNNGYAYATGTSNLITDVTGLENFKSLKVLYFDNQKATNFNFTNMKNLQFLSLWGAPLTSLDVSSLTKLKMLGLSETSLTSIDVSKLTNLEEADFQHISSPPYVTSNGTTVSGFSSLDFSKNTNLTRIYIDYNYLTTIDLSYNTKLQELWASYNSFTTINLTNNTNLTYVVLNNNQLKSFNFKGHGLISRFYTENNNNLQIINVDNPILYTQTRNQCLVSCSGGYAVYTSTNTVFN